jgi:hypothetical protein
VGFSLISALVISACSSSSSSSTSAAGAIPSVSVKCGDQACVK